MEKIIVYLSSCELTDLPFALIQQTTIEEVGIAGTIQQIAQMAKHREVVLIAPAHDVLLLRATVPKLTRQRLLQALPFALEDQLLTDITALHFAVGPYDSNTVPVAIVAKPKIEAWLQAFQAEGLFPSRIIPAPLTLPLVENEWCVHVDVATAWVRTELYSGFACDIANLSTLLAPAFSLTHPHKVVLLNSSAVVSLTTELGLPQEVSEKRVTAAQFFAEILPACETPAINLLQGPFQAKQQLASSKKIWGLVGILASVWILLTLLTNTVSYFILQSEASRLTAQITRIYKANFPNAASVVAPKQRMNEQLQRLTNQSHKNVVLLWLTLVGKELDAAHVIKIQQLDFRDNQLTLTITAPSIANVDRLTHALIQQVNVKQHVALAGSEVKGSLTITGGTK